MCSVHTVHTEMAATPQSRVLVYGGKGALGAIIVSYFKSKNWVNYIYIYPLSVMLYVIL